MTTYLRGARDPQFDAVLTYPDLAKWCADNLPGSSVHLLDGEVIIHTGLTVEMNGELMALGGRG